MSKFVVVLSILFLAICSHVYGETTGDKEVVFDTEFGGLHAKDVIFNTVDAQKFDVMLSTVHSLTFLIDDNDCKDPDPQKESDEFCHSHKRKYIMKQSKAGDTRKGDPKPLQEKDLTEKGKTVEDKIQLGSVHIETKFGIMNSKVEEDPKFWGIKRFKGEGENKGKVEKGNKAEGCLSLLPGKPEFETDFGEKTPMETLITSDALLFKIVSIQLGKVDQVPENTLAQGKITFGSLAVNDQCHSWNLVTKGTMEPWNVQIDALEGVEEVKGKNAIIDTSSEQITVPKNAWEKLNALVKEGECDPTKLSPLKFTIGGLEYAVPATHYLKKTKEGCIRLLAQNSDDLDQKLHLGLPFMRSTCVAADLQGNKVYLSEGVCKKEGGGEKPPTPGGDEQKNGASSTMGMAFSTLMAFVFLAITAIIIH